MREKPSTETKAFPLPLDQRSTGELQALLAKLETDCARFRAIKEANPEIAAKKDDLEMSQEGYDIWQIIWAALPPTEGRIKDIKSILERRENLRQSSE